MDDTPTIRAARVRDYERLLPLWRCGDDHHVMLVPHVFRHVSDATARSKDVFRYLVNDPGRVVLVAEDEASLRGMLIARLGRPPSAPLFRKVSVLFVDHVFVDAGSRRRGIGRGLLEAALDWGRERGAERVELEVYDVNAEAIRFYENAGFGPLRHTLTRQLRAVEA